MILELLMADSVYCDCYMHPDSIKEGYYSFTIGTNVDLKLTRLQNTEIIRELFNA